MTTEAMPTTKLEMIEHHAAQAAAFAASEGCREIDGYLVIHLMSHVMACSAEGFTQAERNVIAGRAFDIFATVVRRQGN